MSKTLIKMQWSPVNQKYLMKSAKGRFIYDFWDCGNVRMIFPHLSKRKVKTYIMTVEERR